MRGKREGEEMSFHNIRKVRRPKKKYGCELCCKQITGEHLYHSCKHDDFYSYRTHKDCFERMLEYCSDCDFNDDCQSNFTECFAEKESEKEVKR